uniref:DUF4371 domain-containing protein n=1 Tax=Ascaris lumbricoides TaxID=6252 RepID=A0A0M3HZ99_ASCLU
MARILRKKFEKENVGEEACCAYRHASQLLPDALANNFQSIADSLCRFGSEQSVDVRGAYNAHGTTGKAHNSKLNAVEVD